MNNDFVFDLQLFAEGDEVHGTAGYINAGTGVETSYSGAGMSAEMKTFYDKVLLEYASPALVHDQFAQKRPIPQGSGKTIEFRKFNSLDKAMTAIQEGVTPSGNRLSVTPVTATVDQYGDYIEMTDLFELTSIDSVVLEATKVLADQAGRTMDTVVRNAMLGGTNVMYCPKYSSGSYTDVSARYQLDSTALLRVKDVFKAAAQLRAANAPTFDGYYVAIIHPYVAYDLMQEAGDQWIDISKYTNPENILRGEIGTLGGVRFVQSSEAKIYASEGMLSNLMTCTVDSYTSATNTVAIAELMTGISLNKLIGKKVVINGEKFTVSAYSKTLSDEGTITLAETPTVNPAQGDVISAADAGSEGVSVFATIFIGRDAYGTTEIEGGGLEQIVKQKGFGNDPLNQRSSVGWKGVKAAVRLAEPYMIRVESGSTFSSTSLAGN